MLSQLLQLSRQSIVYGIGSVAGQLVGFLLIPVYTSHLTPADYGTLEILNVTLAVLAIVSVMGLSTALFYSYFKAEDEDGRKAAVSTALVFLSVTTAVTTLVLLAVAPWLSSSVFGSTAYAGHFRIIFLTLFCDTGMVIGLSVFRARGQSGRYVAASAIRLVVALALNIVFLVVLGRGVFGILEANLIAAAILYLGLIPRLAWQCGLRVSGIQLKEMLSYGLPLIASVLGGLVLTMSDRYFLQFLSTTREVGLYSLGYRFGMVINALLAAPFQTAWMPFIFLLGRDGRAREIYSRVLTYFLLATVLAALAISALSREILAVMATPEFYAAHKVVGLVALSYVLYGCYFVVAVGLHLEGKTKYLALLVVGAAILNLGLNYVLIPPYGMMGAAMATLVCYGLLSVGTFVVSRRYYRVEYEWGRVAKIFLVATLIFGGAMLADGAYSVTHSHYVVGTLKVVVLASYPLLLYFVRFYQPEEIQKARLIARQIMRHIRQRLRIG